MHVKRLEWAGYVVRTMDIRIPKQILKGSCRERRPAGKPGRERRPAGKPRRDEKANCGRMPPNCSI
jgi:hypothetical protein